MSDNFQQRGGGSPWGSPPGGGSGNGSGRGPTPPDIDKIIRELQDKIKKFLPGGASTGEKPVILVIIILAFNFLNISETIVNTKSFFFFFIILLMLISNFCFKKYEKPLNYLIRNKFK